MRKARVAPMNFHRNDDPPPEEHGIADLPINNHHRSGNVTHYFDHRNIFARKNEHGDNIGTENGEDSNNNNTWYNLVDVVTNKVNNMTQNKWRMLTNTVRKMNKITKAFEEVREKLLQDKQRAFNCKNLNRQCLLENHRSKELAAVAQFINSKRDKKEDDGDWLIRYFIDLSEHTSGDETEKTVDFDLLEEKIGNGLDINFVDKHGQSSLHEVARIWHIDVAHFLLTNGRFM